ncbi:hypothetical protein [Paraburkholderia unamae]|uniref:Uncharacterized protein n=1 Tax=Paraburkholderia unamae TaxID=219649 RepID=A0ABX5KKT4_9BURK|nr:hypothetical protein [Paraburkholderia unamae]PVX81250.1 hypothetical protein C7402_111152 [Paraburkholderia unamae]
MCAANAGNWVARNAQPVLPNDSKPVCTAFWRACSALDAIPPDSPERKRIAAAWALEFGPAGLARLAQWWLRARYPVNLARHYYPRPGVEIALVYVLAARYGWLDPLPAAVRSREAQAKQRTAYEEMARKGKERAEAKAAREAARAAKRSTTRRETA